MPSPMPRSVIRRFTLVPKPPREYPSACLGGSLSCAGLGPPRVGTTSGFFFRPARGPAGANDGGINEPQRVTQATLAFPLFQQPREDSSPGAVAAPPPEPGIHALPGSVAFRDVAPGGARVEAPENAVDNAAVILRGTTAAAVMPRLWQERLETFPLLVRQFIAVSHGWSPWGTTISPAELRLLWKKRHFANSA